MNIPLDSCDCRTELDVFPELDPECAEFCVVERHHEEMVLQDWKNGRHVQNVHDVIAHGIVRGGASDAVLSSCTCLFEEEEQMVFSRSHPFVDEEPFEFGEDWKVQCGDARIVLQRS